MWLKPIPFRFDELSMEQGNTVFFFDVLEENKRVRSTVYTLDR